MLIGMVELSPAQQAGRPRYGYKGDPEPSPPRAKVVPEPKPAKKPAPAKPAPSKPAAPKPPVASTSGKPVKKTEPAKPAQTVARPSSSSSAKEQQERERAKKAELAARKKKEEEQRKAAEREKAKALAKKKEQEAAKARAVAAAESKSKKSSGGTSKPAEKEKEKAVASTKTGKPDKSDKPSDAAAGVAANGEEQAPVLSAPPLPPAFTPVKKAVVEEKPFEPAGDGEKDRKKEEEKEETAYQLIVKRKAPEKRALPPLPPGFTQSLYARTIGAGVRMLQSMPEFPKIPPGAMVAAKRRPVESRPAPVPAPARSAEEEDLAETSAPKRPAALRWEPVTATAAGWTREAAEPAEGQTPPKTAARDDKPVEKPVEETPPDAEEDKIDIQSDRQAEYDQDNNRVVFTGKVEMNTRDLRLKTDKLEVFISPEGTTERIEATGNVTLSAGGGDGQPRQTATAGGATYFPETGEVILHDWPQVREGAKTLTSTDEQTKIHLYPDGAVRLDGPNKTTFGR